MVVTTSPIHFNSYAGIKLLLEHLQPRDTWHMWGLCHTAPLQVAEHEVRMHGRPFARSVLWVFLLFIFAGTKCIVSSKSVKDALRFEAGWPKKQKPAKFFRAHDRKLGGPAVALGPNSYIGPTAICLFLNSFIF